MEKEKLLFKLPKCHIDAEFIKYKNNNWKFCIINNNDNKRKMIMKSIDQRIITKIINDLIEKPEELRNKDFKKSYQTLKSKVEAMKEYNLNNNV